MNQGKKLIVYILINIVVSFIAVIAAHLLWENTRLKTVLFGIPTIKEEVTASGTSPEVVDEGSSLLIEISEVGGVGNLATEYIKLSRPAAEGAETISLTDWRIVDENNHNYAILEQSGLASLDLHSPGAVDIYTKEGESTPIELYLGLKDPIWEPGETVTLIDPQGEVHDTYLIP